MRNGIFLAPVLLILFTKINAQCLNLVQNHDFELGNTAFASEYTSCSSNNCLIPESRYVVGKNANYFHYLFHGTDHTSGSGYYMMVNGSGTPDRVIWSQSITVKPNTNYKFSTWVLSLLTGQLAKLQFQINGIDIGPIFEAPNQTNLWLKYEAPTWNSGSNTTAIIKVLNQNTSTGGNDFGLDDIVFEEPCALPLFFLEFEANWIPRSDQVLISWDVNDLQKIKYFEILKSYDGTNFTLIQTVHKGSKRRHQYVVDVSAEKPLKVYYKIKCLNEYQQEICISKSICVNLFNDITNIYPNPCNQNFITISNSSRNILYVEVFNLLGQVCKKIYVNNENSSIVIGIDDIPNGNYIIKVTDSEYETTTNNMLILK